MPMLRLAFVCAHSAVATVVGWAIAVSANGGRKRRDLKIGAHGASLGTDIQSLGAHSRT